MQWHLREFHTKWGNSDKQPYWITALANGELQGRSLKVPGSKHVKYWEGTAFGRDQGNLEGIDIASRFGDEEGRIKKLMEIKVSTEIRVPWPITLLPHPQNMLFIKEVAFHRNNWRGQSWTMKLVNHSNPSTPSAETPGPGKSKSLENKQKGSQHPNRVTLKRK